ncbi:MAG TPA: N-acetylmuramic acid 6-phosphate etherase [Planctomycetota bacterium]|nr:N-acetylmuramic acid 6-phosphate etherase [Planctomycetota bacterium]
MRPVTERRNPGSRRLDRLSSREIVALMHREDARVPRAAAKVADATARAVDLIVSRLRRGGRLFLVGAGTSGRLAALEAAECPPTFGTPPSMVQAVIAGGERALTKSVEGAEDDPRAGRRSMSRVTARDAVIGISASGSAPFVVAALAGAHKKGAATILLSCTPPHRIARVSVTPIVGPEVIAGSTRLKAGTATKLVLNAITVAVMTRLGKVHENLMVDVQPTNAKLRARARRIVRELTGKDPEAALKAARGRVKTAVVMLRRGVGAREADRLLGAKRGVLRGALEGR